MDKKDNKKSTKKGVAKEVKSDEFDQRIIDLARVTRVMAGGKRMRFRATVAIGDGKGRVGLAVAKGADVTIAINKAVTKAKKNLITVKIVNDTIAHKIIEKFKSAKVLLKPAPGGTGIIAGGPVRSVIELSGIKNIVSKMQGSKNKINNARAVINSFQKLRQQDFYQRIKDNQEGKNKEVIEKKVKIK
jgi:small subunit ribosomal protein S5